MPSVELPVAGITFDSILYVLALLVAFSGVIVAIVKGIEAWRKVSVRDKVKDLESRMNEVEERLDKGNKRFKEQGDDLGQVLTTMHAMMMHMISGNDVDKLRETEKELTAYMAKRKTHEEESI